MALRTKLTLHIGSMGSLLDGTDDAVVRNFSRGTQDVSSGRPEGCQLNSEGISSEYIRDSKLCKRGDGFGTVLDDIEPEDSASQAGGGQPQPPMELLRIGQPMPLPVKIYSLPDCN